MSCSGSPAGWIWVEPEPPSAARQGVATKHLTADVNQVLPSKPVSSGAWEDGVLGVIPWAGPGPEAWCRIAPCPLQLVNKVQMAEAWPGLEPSEPSVWTLGFEVRPGF